MNSKQRATFQNKSSAILKILKNLYLFIIIMWKKLHGMQDYSDRLGYAVLGGSLANLSV